MDNPNQPWANLTPAGLAGLADHEFYLFAQWLHGSQPSGQVEGSGFVDFTYTLSASRELLRVYAGRVPVSWAYDVQQAGQGYQRVSVYMRARRPAAAERLTSDFPLALDVVDMDGLAARLADKRRRRDWRAVSLPGPGTARPSRDHTWPPVRRRVTTRGDWSVGLVVAGLIALSVLLVVLAILSQR